MMSFQRSFTAGLVFYIVSTMTMVSAADPDPATTVPGGGVFDVNDYLKATGASTDITTISEKFIFVSSGSKGTFTKFTGRSFMCEKALQETTKKSDCTVADGKRTCTENDYECTSPKEMDVVDASGNPAKEEKCMACQVDQKNTEGSITVDCSTTFATNYADMSRQYDGGIDDKHILAKLVGDATDGTSYRNAFLAASYRPLTGTAAKDVYCMGVKFTGTLPTDLEVKELTIDGAATSEQSYTAAIVGGVVGGVVLIGILILVAWYCLKKRNAVSEA